MKRTILIALLCAACDQEQSELTSAYEEAVVQARSSQTVSDVSAPRELGAPMDPLAFAADLEAFISAESDCAEISSSDGVVSVDFGEEGCDYLDRTLTGALSAVITDSDDGTHISMELLALSDGIVTLDGFAEASISESAREFSADLHISHDADADPACDRDGEERPEGDEMGGEPPEGGEGMERPRPPAEVDMLGERTEAPLDGSFDSGIVVSGSRQMSAEEGEASMTETDLEIVAGELVPQAGTIVHDGPRGTATISFARIDADTIEVSVSSDRGEESFQVDAVTGERR